MKGISDTSGGLLWDMCRTTKRVIIQRHIGDENERKKELENIVNAFSFQ
jgi:hypothetical protein